MTYFFCRKHISFCRKAVSAVVMLCFSLFMVVGPAGSQTIYLPNFGLTPPFQPPVLRGMTVHPENPLLFDFIVDRGQDKIGNDLLKDESTKLIKYFLTSMTIPDKDAWVNLSPYEKDRIIPDALGQTEMGRQMLEQDYVLKQLAASLTNPDTELGKKYWDEVNKAKTLDVGGWTLEKTASVQPPATSDFNKVWIVPDGATVVEKDGFAYITESKLTVMLDEEYQAVCADSTVGAYCNTPLQKNTGSSAVSISTQVFRQRILPKLIEEVNTGKNFAATRQVYQSVILAAWYKRALKDSLLGRIYADKSKIAGVETDVKDIKQKVYEQYLEAFKKGAYNVIKEEDGLDGELIPRKYFSGGEGLSFEFSSTPLTVTDNPSEVNRAASVITQAGDQIVLVAAIGAEFATVTQGAMIVSPKLDYQVDIDKGVRNNLIKISDELGSDVYSHRDKLVEGRIVGAGLTQFNSRVLSGLAERIFKGLLALPTSDKGVFHALDVGAGSGFAISDMWHIARDMQIPVKFETGGLTPTAPHYLWAQGMSVVRLKILISKYVQDHSGDFLLGLNKYIRDVMEDKKFNDYVRSIYYKPVQKPETLDDIPIKDAVDWAIYQDHIPVPLALAISLQEAGYNVFKYVDDSVAPRQIIGRFSKAASEMSERQNFIYDSLGGLYYTFKNAASVAEIKDTWRSLKKLLHPQGILFFSASDALADAMQEAPDEFIVFKMVSDEKSPTMVFYKDSYCYQGLTHLLSGNKYSIRRNVISVSVSNPDIFMDQFIAVTVLKAKEEVSAASSTIKNVNSPGNIAQENVVALKPFGANVPSSPSAKQPAAPGGIDFDSSKLNLQIKRDARGVPLPLPEQDLENININGLTPVILRILPVNAQTLPILGQSPSQRPRNINA